MMTFSALFTSTKFLVKWYFEGGRTILLFFLIVKTFKKISCVLQKYTTNSREISKRFTNYVLLLCVIPS